MASSRPKSISLLLVGRTGNGKSSIGNSILGKKVFTPRGSSAAIQVEILKGDAVINSQEITVVDGPGVGDVSFDNHEDIQATLNQVDEVFKLSPYGFSAVVIVLKYGIRFTKQEKDAITMTKSIFGPDVVRKYGVIVMSHGDSFDLDMEDEETSFEDWCKEQTGDVKALFIECDYRCVLFNNRTKDQEKLKAQYDGLMSKVASILSQFESYTPEHYDEAGRGRKHLLVRSKLPALEKKTEKVLDEISDQLNQLGGCNREGSLDILNACSAKINDLKTYLQQEDQDTGCTDSLLTQVEVSETTIQLKLQRLQNAADGDRRGTSIFRLVYNWLCRANERIVGWLEDVSGIRIPRTVPLLVVLAFVMYFVPGALKTCNVYLTGSENQEEKMAVATA